MIGAEFFRRFLALIGKNRDKLCRGGIKGVTTENCATDIKLN